MQTEIGCAEVRCELAANEEEVFAEVFKERWLKMDEGIGA